jgi:hypothetical protein
LQSKKHNSTIKSCNLEDYRKEIVEKEVKEFICKKCEKHYKDRTGLWRHNKICNSNNEGTVSMELFAKVVEKNCELTEKIIEMTNKCQTITNTNCHNRTTNNNQKHFNLQFFLNETCKDAINMVEFVKSIQFQLGDLEETARVGYVDGISRIFVRALNDMEVNKRPIHCTDIKRETVYVKNNDNWEKEGPEKKNLKKAVDYIANKNMYQIDEWKEENPNWTDYESQEGQVLNKIYMATTGGGTEEEDEKYVKKIIKNVLREVVVEKEE